MQKNLGMVENSGLVKLNKRSALNKPKIIMDFENELDDTIGSDEGLMDDGDDVPPGGVDEEKDGLGDEDEEEEVEGDE